jgi:hypothetical protein
MLVLYTIHDSNPRVQIHNVSIYFLSLRQLHNPITEQLHLRTLVRVGTNSNNYYRETAPQHTIRYTHAAWPRPCGQATSALFFA